MKHAAMRVLLAQHMADTGENVFVRKIPMHVAGVFLVSKGFPLHAALGCRIIPIRICYNATSVFLCISRASGSRI
jgi:hypothetical protein